MFGTRSGGAGTSARWLRCAPPRWSGAPRAVVEAAEAAAPEESTAGIAWFGYDAPQIIPEAAFEGYADDAQPHLRTFQEGLRATHEGPPSHNTVLAHSYGTTVVGHTARDGALDADALVFAGSPGDGVDHVDQLHRPPATVHSTTTDNDEIALTNIRPNSPDGDPVADAMGTTLDAHGRDPSSPEFGAEVFRADPEGGHSDYWTRGNASLDSFGLIAVGKEPTR
jgi:pimeloyl-ACP methyl ester carboxylesterase